LSKKWGPLHNGWTANEISWPADRPEERQEGQPEPEQDEVLSGERGNEGSVPVAQLYSPAEENSTSHEEQDDPVPLVSWDEAKALLDNPYSNTPTESNSQGAPGLSLMARLALQGAARGFHAPVAGRIPSVLWRSPRQTAPPVPTLSQVAKPRMPRLGVPVQGIRSGFRSMPVSAMVRTALRHIR
jgi:hypothetical protein